MKFLFYHTVPKNPERVSLKVENSFFSAVETSEKTNSPPRKIDFFQNSVRYKNRRMPKNPKRDPLGSLNVFFTNQQLQKIQGVTL